MKIRRLAGALALLTCMTLSEAAHASAPIVCQKCSSDEIVEIQLRLSANGENSSWHQRELGKSWFNTQQPSGIKAIAFRKVKNVQAIQDALRELSQSCQRVKQLALDSHGESGIALLSHTPGGYLTGSSLADAFPQGAECVFTRDAELTFSGCRLGKGCDGTLLLADLGRRVLKKSGKVTAATATMTGIPWMTSVHPHNLDYQVLRFDSSGMIVDASSQSCRNELAESLNFFNQEDSRTMLCVVASTELEAYRLARDNALTAYDELRKTRGNDLDTHAVNLNYIDSKTWRGLRDELSLQTTRMSEALDRSGCEPYSDMESVFPGL